MRSGTHDGAGLHKRRAAAGRGPRDAAIIAVLLDAGARAEECARLDAGDFAVTARTGGIRLRGKGDEVRSVPLSKRARDLISAWLDKRGRHPGPAWPGQRGPLTVSGITEVVLAAGADAGIPGLRPLRCRHTFGTRLRQGRSRPRPDPGPPRPRLHRHRGPVLPLRTSRERRRHRADLRH